ncbi:MAG TPA: T9SS type A sorting domain-containing protein [Ferruginibacter sp.]|jgi:hypothetical protein|nr:T9SS type A sorting domain-containing protein [Ferruginibacter sp.]
MKKFFIFFLLISFVGVKVFAQSGACPVDVRAYTVTDPSCGSSNGSFNVVTGFRGTDLAQVSLDGFATFSTDAATPGTVEFTSMPAGIYTISIRSAGNTGTICQTFTFAFIASQYDTTATLTSTAATGCFNTNGSIVLSGLTGATDSVSWLSDLTSPTFVRTSSLASNTIPNLIPGNYFVTLKSSTGNYCYSTHKVTVGNSGVACAAPTFCGNATDPNNLFPNGTFGSGGNPDGTNAQINGPPLPDSEIQYTYQPLGYRGPEDGFYSITNNTYLGSDFLGHDPTGANGNNTPFNGFWYNGYDHDHSSTPNDGENGYMLVVNASYTPDIVIQQEVNNMCTNKKYQFSAWIRDLDLTAGQIPAKIEFLVNGVGLYTTPAIATGVTSAWQQVGFTFQTSSPMATISIRNDTTGGQGNDWALDDIYVGDCVPSLALNPLTVACGSSGDSATATVTDASNIYDTYEWLLNTGSGYNPIGGIQTVAGFNASPSHVYTAKVALPSPITTLNTGWSYKLVLGTTASDIASPVCYYTDSTSLTINNSCDVILPIKLVSIKAVQLNSTTGEVTWTVASQTNVSYYELEKSTDGKDYNYVTAVTANNSITIYTADDNDLYNGETYYRVKEVDNDGSVYYSTIVPLDATAAVVDQIKIYHNPVVNNELQIIKPANTIIKGAIIIDAIGQTVMEVNTFDNVSNAIQLSNLPTGFYNVKLISNTNEVTNLKFIKE